MASTANGQIVRVLSFAMTSHNLTEVMRVPRLTNGVVPLPSAQPGLIEQLRRQLFILSSWQR